jgi:TonB-dependent SusC/RagA subfamily outer membrane receptor
VRPLRCPPGLIFIKFDALRIFHAILVVVSLTPCFAQQARTGMTLEKVVSKFGDYTRAHPQEKLYLQLDKPLYAAGEDMWFSTFLVSASRHIPDSISKVVYVELFNPSKKLIQRRTLYSPDGFSHGDFHLADSLSPGTYVLRAYTNNMRNTEEDFFFLKEVTVLNINATLKTPATETGLADITFFPEGGNLLVNVENRVAFKAISRTRGGVETEGEIVDASGKVITTFRTEHDGMGVFRMIPTPHTFYFAKVSGLARTFPLPPSTQQGYQLRLVETDAFINARVRTNLDAALTRGGIIVVAQSRGVICFAARSPTLHSELITNIPKNKLPTGIVQVTVLDGSAVPQCERLVFVNHEDKLKVDGTPDKSIYTKRGRMELSIHVAKKDGTPAKGNFSMSAYDGSKIPTRETYPSNIVNYILLSSDLKGKISNPGYYLADTLPTTKHHLDLLMMTHGWRRFTWKSILTDTLAPIPYLPEQGIRVSGQVLETSRKPAPNSKIKIVAASGDVVMLTANRQGKFYDDGFMHYDSTQFVIQTDDAKGRQRQLGFILDPFNTTAGLEYTPADDGVSDAGTFLDQVNRRKVLSEGIGTDTSATLLKDVVIKSTRIERDPPPFRLYGVPDATVNFKDMPYIPISVLQGLQGKVAGVVVSGTPGFESVTIRGLTSYGTGGDPLFLLDGMPVDIDLIRNFPTTDVASIDILKGPSAAMYGARGSAGVVAIITKKGVSPAPPPAFGIHNVKYPGLYRAREFYAPRYDVSDSRNEFQDIRNTLYWNPSVTTDGDGTAHISFYTSDIASDYNIVVEGISVDGVPGVGSFKISVR